MRLAELQDLALVLAQIEAEQQDYPGWCEELARNIVHSELRRMEREMGVGLDEIAGGSYAA